MQRPMMPLELPVPEWIGVLRDEVEKSSIAAVARQIDMPRPSLSLLLSGKYPAKLDKVSARFAPVVLATFRDQVFCPHLRKGIARDACQRHATAPMSVSDPDRFRHSQACKTCPRNPVTTKAATAAKS